MNTANTESPTTTARHDLVVLSSIRKIIHAFDVHSRRLSSRYGITAPQLICLQAVIDHDEITAREISKYIHLGTSTLVGVLDRLESKGLIERRRDARDRRRILITATKQGRDFIATMPSPLEEHLHIALSQLPEMEQARIAAALARVGAMIESEGSEVGEGNV